MPSRRGRNREQALQPRTIRVESIDERDVDQTGVRAVIFQQARQLLPAVVDGLGACYCHDRGCGADDDVAREVFSLSK